MAVGPTPSAAYRARLAALADAHGRWVDRKVSVARFDPTGRKRKSDYNQHYADLEADDDAFHAAARSALDLGDPPIVAMRSRLHTLDNGICTTCRPVLQRASHSVLDDGVCVTCNPARTVARFDPLEPRDPHSGKWMKGSSGGHSAARKLLAAIEDGNDEEILNQGEKLDKPTFDALSSRDRKDIQDEFTGTALGKAVPERDRKRAHDILVNLGLKSGKAKSAPKSVPKSAPKVAPKHAPSTSPPKAHTAPHAPKGAQEGSFDSANAARELDALEAAPTRVRALYEAGLTAEERRKFVAEVNAMSDAEALRYGGRGQRSTIGEHERLSLEERDRISAAADEYMQQGYIPINKALYDGTPADAETQQWIDDLDKLISLSRIDKDAIFHRGTVTPEKLPDEMTLSGFTSLTSSTATADSFVTNDLRGKVAGGKDRAGVPTVMTIRVPKGTHAIGLSPDDVLGEVLLHRGARIRRVDADDFDGIQYAHVRYVTYEVIP